MNNSKNPAPGSPGQFSPWTSGAKTGIGRALNTGSELSFTIGKGLLNEVYFPQEDTACIRECGLVITGKGWLSDERTDTRHRGRMVRPGVPMYVLENKCVKGRYTLYKEILADPERDAVLQRVRFEPGKEAGLSLHVYLTPHLHNSGQENEAWIDEYKGITMLFASGGGLVLAMACDKGWKEWTVGYIGTSDGVTDLRANGRLTSHYDFAGPGQVQLCAAVGTAGTARKAAPGVPSEAKLDYRSGVGAPSGEAGIADRMEFVLAIGFGHTLEGAAHQAKSALLGGFDEARQKYCAQWDGWQKDLWEKGKKRAIRGKYLKESAAALRISESRRYPGGVIASLSIPWGETRGINEGMGYHLVWPRDLVETAWGFLALGAKNDALRILNYLFATQDTEGKWSQNMWLDGRPSLGGLQLDEVALPVLLLDSCHQRRMIGKERWERYQPGLRRAVDFILQRGPMTQQDRWEQQAGLSTFTIATEVAALVAAGEMFDHLGDHAEAALCRGVADDWNQKIEQWTYVRGTETAKRCGVEGYYVRINPFLAPAQEIKDQQMVIKHWQQGGEIAVGEIVSPDALALVRFGLRKADDPRILNTVRVVDAELRVELPAGPCWRRFTKDAYGEDGDGNPFVGTGRGRCWPLLTGERAHYELAAGHLRLARKLFRTMEGFSHQGFLPEQVWDAEDIPAKGLTRGRFTGSAMPLTWAQAEYLKLAVSLRKGRVFDMPRLTAERYLGR